MEGISDILANLGFNINVAVLTTANFLLVLWILQRFVFSKLDKSLDNRQQVLSESLENADRLKTELAHAEEKAAQIVAEAHREASEFKSKSREEFEKWSAEAKAAHEDKLLQERKEMQHQLEADHQAMLKSLKQEVAELALEATEKIIGEKFDSEQDRMIVQQYLDQLDNND